MSAVLRRAQGRRASGRLRVGALVVDPPSREVHLHGQRLALSQKEFAMLRLLASDPTRVWTKLELLRSVWGHQSLGTSRTLDSHACRLRHKLALHGERWVVNVWGVGYRLLDAHTVAGRLEVAARAEAARLGLGLGAGGDALPPAMARVAARDATDAALVAGVVA